MISIVLLFLHLEFHQQHEPRDAISLFISADDYNLNQALLSARNEWRVEMMTAAANNIAYDFASFDVPYNSTLVTWNDNLRVMEFIDYSVSVDHT